MELRPILAEVEEGRAVIPGPDLGGLGGLPGGSLAAPGASLSCLGGSWGHLRGLGASLGLLGASWPSSDVV